MFVSRGEFVSFEWNVGGRCRCCCCRCWWWWSWQVLSSIVHLVNLVFQQVDGTRKWALPPGVNGHFWWARSRDRPTAVSSFLVVDGPLLESWFDYSVFSPQSGRILSSFFFPPPPTIYLKKFFFGGFLKGYVVRYLLFKRFPSSRWLWLNRGWLIRHFASNPPT